MISDPQRIQTRMAEIRDELDRDVEAVVEQAKELTDWRSIVKRHPFITIASAAAIGFLIVPRGRKVVQADADALARLARENKIEFRGATTKPKPGLVRKAGVVLAGIALRSAASAVANQFAAGSQSRDG